MKHISFVRKTFHSDTEHNVVHSWHVEALAGEQRHLMAVSEPAAANRKQTCAQFLASLPPTAARTSVLGRLLTER